jgi:glycyl-tRNA synthetase
MPLSVQQNNQDAQKKTSPVFLLLSRLTGAEPREFNLLFKSNIGPIADSTSEVYLRPETAQGIFVNFHTITTVMRKQLPFGNVHLKWN